MSRFVTSVTKTLVIYWDALKQERNIQNSIEQSYAKGPSTRTRAKIDVNFISPLSCQLKALEIHSRIVELFFSIITFIKVTDSGCQQRLPSVMKWKSLFRRRKREVRSTVIHSFIDNQRPFCSWHIIMLEWIYILTASLRFPLFHTKSNRVKF